MTQNSEREGRTKVLLIVLATVGGLTLLGFLFFSSLIALFLFKSGAATSPLISSSGDGVGIVELQGVIGSPEDVLKQLRQFREDNHVKAIVVRIDSPGGAVGASQEIYRELRQVDKVKPVVASLVNTAASGAFYSACGTRWIVSNPGTVTGSIGVIMQLPNIAGLLDKLGIKTTVIKSGKLKDLASITRELTPEERQVLQNVMDDIHHQFIEDVAKGRKLPVDKVAAVADGRIFSGRQALALHFVDELGNFSDAIKKAAKLGGIKGEPRLIYPEKDKFTALREILEESGAHSMVKFLGLLLRESSQVPK
ncbi:MAG: signal peptide peptidase SppA [Thermodesulfobacteria bacterium]|nr:signal peptide peptidase SppA [Thermodesulfobacteriota bacterium]